MPKKAPIFNGVLLINKPTGMTSHDAVSEIRHIIRQRRVGHAGTLDPAADGLLVVCLGKGTKMVQFLTGSDKTYEAEIYLGKTSPTFDREGITADQMPMKAPDMTDAEINELLLEFTGRQQQQVPAYSAVRVNGERLHKLARQGIEVELPIREINIHSIELLEYSAPILRIRVKCSKGTYIRSLANDLGQRLQCGGYLAALTRTKSGHFSLEDALTLEEVEQAQEDRKLTGHLISFEKALKLPGFVVEDDFVPGVVSGKTVSAKDVSKTSGSFKTGDRVVLRNSSGLVLAVGEAEIDSPELKSADVGQKLFNYVRVLN